FLNYRAPPAHYPFPYTTLFRSRGPTGAAGSVPPRADGNAALGILPTRPARARAVTSGVMRVLHTGDWHVGKTLYGYDRTPEIAAALEESLDVAMHHGVDAGLVAGDLYHSRNPATEARLPVVVIAGNHDSPRRLDAIAGFMRNHRVHIVGRPRRPEEGGVVTVDVGSERMVVACLPFVSERVLRTSGELFQEGLGDAITTYQQKTAALMHGYAAAFRNDTVNVLLMHGTMDGAKLSGSEYTFHSG